MAWFRVEDTFPFHPKTIAAGNAACGLWARAGAWCCLHLTDGFIPEDIVQSMGGDKLAPQLVKAGLWEKVTGGYKFHEWDGDGGGSRNWTREQVEERRKADRERKRRQGRK